MRKRAEGLNWIDKGNSAQIQWATDYLMQRGRLSKEAATSGIKNYEDLLKEGLDQEKSADGVRTLQRMQAAWRQRIYRQPHHGRKPYTFTLPLQTKQHLSEQAETCGHTETEHLIQLIERGHEEAILQSKGMKRRQAKERKDLPKARAEARAQQMYAKSLELHLEQRMKACFAAEGVSDEELDQKVKREMDYIHQEAWKAIEEQRRTDPRLKHLSTL